MAFNQGDVSFEDHSHQKYSIYLTLLPSIYKRQNLLKKNMYMTFKWATHSLIANVHNRPHAGSAETL